MLTERTPGDPANYVDPKEAYSISATASDIAAFFGRAMPESGWSKDGVSTETGLFFQKGNLMIVVIIGDGKFSLMGSSLPAASSGLYPKEFFGGDPITSWRYWVGPP